LNLPLQTPPTPNHIDPLAVFFNRYSLSTYRPRPETRVWPLTSTWSPSLPLINLPSRAFSVLWPPSIAPPAQFTAFGRNEPSPPPPFFSLPSIFLRMWNSCSPQEKQSLLSLSPLVHYAIFNWRSRLRPSKSTSVAFGKWHPLLT